MSRRTALLAVLGLVLAITVWVYFPDSDGGAPAGGVQGRGAAAAGDPELGGASPAAGGAAAHRGGSGGDAGAGTPVRVIPLHFERLTKVAASYTPGRDPWRFVEPPPPPPPPPHVPTAAELQAIKEAQEAAARLATQQAIEAAKPKPPPFTMAFLGSFGPSGRRIAVFSDGPTIYNAHEGDTLNNQFIVARIGYESVDIQFVGFPQEPAQRRAVGH
ncbi:MAG TPA: hypothetical protein VHR45_03020 [Thermoanaerobaculia bacterium]|nr:hypothetical protein [Thermoanaerobaculia bacterium]